MEASEGNPAPDALLELGRTEKIRLSQLWREKPLVLVFLRHMG